jgi:hypothetical protein
MSIQHHPDQLDFFELLEPSSSYHRYPILQQDLVVFANWFFRTFSECEFCPFYPRKFSSILPVLTRFFNVKFSPFFSDRIEVSKKSSHLTMQFLSYMSSQGVVTELFAPTDSISYTYVPV